MKPKSVLTILLLIYLLIPACSLFNGDPEIKVYMTSQTATTLLYGKSETVTKLEVTLLEWEIHKTSGGSWVQLENPGSTVDLMSIQSINQLLSTTEIEEGSYNQIRFYVTNATVTTESGVYEAEVPSEKIDLSTKFTVQDGQTAHLYLEIDPEASLVTTGGTPTKYKIVPVIHVKKVEVEDVTTGIN